MRTIALRLGQRKRAFQPREGGGRVALRVLRERLQHKDLDHASGPPTVLGGLQEALQQVQCLLAIERSAASRVDGPGAPWRA